MVFLNVFWMSPDTVSCPDDLKHFLPQDLRSDKVFSYLSQGLRRSTYTFCNCLWTFLPFEKPITLGKRKQCCNLVACRLHYELLPKCYQDKEKKPSSPSPASFSEYLENKLLERGRLCLGFFRMDVSWLKNLKQAVPKMISLRGWLLRNVSVLFMLSCSGHLYSGIVRKVQMNLELQKSNFISNKLCLAMNGMYTAYVYIHRKSHRYVIYIWLFSIQR